MRERGKESERGKERERELYYIRIEVEARMPVGHPEREREKGGGGILAIQPGWEGGRIKRKKSKHRRSTTGMKKQFVLPLFHITPAVQEGAGGTGTICTVTRESVAQGCVIMALFTQGSEHALVLCGAWCTCTLSYPAFCAL